ncbi:unnamed protein product [Penicillium nalgiovense]|nr:unnamed protein product [Penicillium nalgiovense]
MSLRGALLTQGLGCGELGNAAVSCRELGNAAVSCRELVNAAVSCGSHLSSQRPPAEFTCTFLHSPGSWQRGSASLTSLGSWQRQPSSRRLSSPQTREGHHDTSECEDRIAQLVARVTVSLISVEAISTTLKGCLETLWPTEPSLDLAYFLPKLRVECGEPLSSTVEKKATPQKYGSYISSNLQLNRSTRLHSTCPHFNHGYHFLMRVEVLRQMPK